MKTNKPKVYELTLNDLALIIEFVYKHFEKGHNLQQTVKEFKEFWLTGKDVFSKGKET